MIVNILLLATSLVMPVIGPASIFPIMILNPRVSSWLNIKYQLLVEILVISIIFTGFLITTGNEVLLRSLILFFINTIYFGVLRSGSWNKNRKFLVDSIYYINIIILILSYYYNPLAEILSRSQTDTARIGGLMGYDYVAFFVSVYIISKIETNEIGYDWKLLLNLGLAVFVVINSGRFGFIVLLVLLIYVVLKFYKNKIFLRSILLLLLILTISFLLLQYRSERIMLIYQTYYAFISSILNGDSSAFSLISEDASSGFYTSSPLVLIEENGLALNNIASHLIPSDKYISSDSGPAYMILNVGVFLTIMYYYLFYRCLRFAKVKNIFIIAVIILTDLKFRSVFSVFPMFWIYMNSFEEAKS